MGKKLSGTSKRLFFSFICIFITPFLICGCGSFHVGFLTGSTFEEANDFFNQGNYKAALNKYEQIIKKYPPAGDRVLFKMGIIYAYPGNEQKDYQKSLEYFQKLIKDYPDSGYRKDSEAMISLINNITIKDKSVITQQTQVESLEREVKSKGDEIVALRNNIDALEREGKCEESEIAALQKKIEELEQTVYAIRNGPADMILIEKKDRRLTLISKDKILKTYRIALGGNPNGPKEREGDNKTPEGTYIIDSRNKNSQYHLALHISYPNETDKKRAKELGVSPGKDIMIHGIKNGYSSMGNSHAERDWTQGCIAVTDDEIEEIDQLVPNGTVVIIKP